jgi:AP-3 complex subunit delta
MWERSLQDLIRGLRSHKTSSKLELDAFIEEALKEIRVELKGNDMELKAEGVMKMCYVRASKVLAIGSVVSSSDSYSSSFQLMMLYPIPPPPSFAFHVVEVMSSPRYHLKRESREHVDARMRSHC